jgi:hypothetical protein
MNVSTPIARALHTRPEDCASAIRGAVAVSLLLALAAALGFDTRPSVLVYPSGPTVPENLLRIELHFSAPLHNPLTIDEVKLFDVNGREIDNPFLGLPLPASYGKRVTILLHPGRVKSGLRANLVFGRVLHAGSMVTLVVEHPRLGQPVRKSWEVTGFDAAPRGRHNRRWTRRTREAGPPLCCGWIPRSVRLQRH